MTVSSCAEPVVRPMEFADAPEFRALSLLLVTWLTLALGLLGCGGGDSTGGDAPVATVTVTPDQATVQVGSTVQLTAVLEDADGNQLSGRAVDWSIDPTAVAGVNATGLVNGVTLGSATVTATSEGHSGSATIQVTAGSGGPGPLPAGAMIAYGGKDPTPWALGYDQLNRTFTAFDAGSPVPPGGEAVGFLSQTGPSVTTSLLFVGGYASASTSDPSPSGVLLFPETGSSIAVEMAEGRIGHTLTRLLFTDALVTGGFNADGAIQTAEIFDENAHTFRPAGDMTVGRGSHAAALLADRQVLVTGGLIPDGGGPATIDTRSTEFFNPNLESFVAGPDMNETRFNHSAIALDDGRVLVLGGNGRATAEVYDPAGNDFTPVGNMSTVHGLGHAAVKLQDGRVLVLGGAVNVIDASAVAEIFDPATDEFTRIDDMTTTRMHHFAVVLPNGEVLIGGGQNDSGDILASAEIYDPVADTFTAIEDMPITATEQAAAAVTR